jgi:hypothetical protein
MGNITFENLAFDFENPEPNTRHTIRFISLDNSNNITNVRPTFAESNGFIFRNLWGNNSASLVYWRRGRSGVFLEKIRGNNTSQVVGLGGEPSTNFIHLKDFIAFNHGSIVGSAFDFNTSTGPNNIIEDWEVLNNKRDFQACKTANVHGCHIIRGRSHHNQGHGLRAQGGTDGTNANHIIQEDVVFDNNGGYGSNWERGTLDLKGLYKSYHNGVAQDAQGFLVGTTNTSQSGDITINADCALIYENNIGLRLAGSPDAITVNIWSGRITDNTKQGISIASGKVLRIYNTVVGGNGTNFANSGTIFHAGLTDKTGNPITPSGGTVTAVSIDNDYKPVINAVSSPAALDVTVSWSNVGASLYVMQVATDNQFTENTLVFAKSLAGTSTQIKDTLGKLKLSADTTYHIRVYGINGTTSISNWSDTVSFTTGALTAVPPVLQSPSDEATGVDIAINFQWVSGGGAPDEYEFEISESEGFDPLVHSQSGSWQTSLFMDALIEFETNIKAEFND